MEARSLADLNLLASNPPQYPQNPAEDKQEPVTLYISRIPGTRDIILSPVKPQLKNVTADDVNSSLYYVHLEMQNPGLAHDAAEHAAQPHRGDTPGRSSGESSSTRTVPRKPLPAQARPVTPESSTKNSHAQLLPNTLGGQNGNRTVPGSGISSDNVNQPLADSATGLSGISQTAPPPAHAPDIPTGPVARKPLGPRPMVMDSLATEAHTGAEDVSPVSSSMPAQDECLPQINSSEHALAGSHRRSSSSTKHGSRQPSTPFTLTLIRRDPSTGNQWNVARISSRQLDLSDSSTASDDTDEQSSLDSPKLTASSHPSISVLIENNGYGKFRNMPLKKSLDLNGEQPSAEALRNLAAREPATDVSAFSRQVVMGWTKSWRSSLKEQLHRIDKTHQARLSQVFTSDRRSIDSHSHSVQSPTEQSGHPQAGMKPRGYVFTSPWDGKCEFRTGTNGRSLKCYHTLHDGHSQQMYNPLAAQQRDTLPNFGSGSSAAAAISELRFNLPSSELFSLDKDNHRPGRDSWRGNFDKVLRSVQQQRDNHFGDQQQADREGSSREDPSYDDDDGVLSPLEVHVGRERAGGGSRGNRAKLGKLIVYNDGLKMLDLVVAANMGVWWTSWERTF